MRANRSHPGVRGALMKFPVGQYLDKHPFVATTLLVFVVVSAIPIRFFLLLVLLASLAAFVGVVLLEGLVFSVGGFSLLCVLCGLGFVALAMSGTIIMPYVMVSSLIRKMHVNVIISSFPFEEIFTNNTVTPVDV
ncbi:lipid droplet assembly factor 1 [Sturnira hondurensis]|uniref:lipid droplet assembly factor 1 n=1 Tax=Sturnira hondurensis TaxID=192404 RepID=UPI00187A59F5|nr:lipid droplet assembly factor 1 [Sturnira hondurensis]